MKKKGTSLFHHSLFPYLVHEIQCSSSVTNIFPGMKKFIFLCEICQHCSQSQRLVERLFNRRLLNWSNFTFSKVVDSRPLGLHSDDYLETEAVHFEKHFKGEEHHEEQVGNLLEVVQPSRLAIMLGSQYTGVEEHQDYDQPEHGLGLDCPPAGPPGPSVELLQVLLFLLPPRFRLIHDAFTGSFVFSLVGQFCCNINCN